MTKKNPIYGQGFHHFSDEKNFSNDPWHERYRYGNHYRRGPKNTDYRAIPPQARLKIYDPQIGQLGGGSRSASGTEKDYSGRGPRGYQRADDKIWEDVCDALANAFEVDASDMEVYVEDNVVFLSGNANTPEEAWRAEKLAYNVYGVDSVRNQLHIVYGVHNQKSLS